MSKYFMYHQGRIGDGQGDKVRAAWERCMIHAATVYCRRLLLKAPKCYRLKLPFLEAKDGMFNSEQT